MKPNYYYVGNDYKRNITDMVDNMYSFNYIGCSPKIAMRIHDELKYRSNFMIFIDCFNDTYHPELAKINDLHLHINGNTSSIDHRLLVNYKTMVIYSIDGEFIVSLRKNEKLQNSIINGVYTMENVGTRMLLDIGTVQYIHINTSPFKSGKLVFELTKKHRLRIHNVTKAFLSDNSISVSPDLNAFAKVTL